MLLPARLILNALAANVFFASQILAQGVNTPSIDLAIPGDWQARPEWVQGRVTPPIFPFYEREQGTALYIRGGEWPWKAEELENFIGQMKQILAEPTAHPGFAHFLATAWFPFPPGYLKKAPLAKEPALQTDFGPARRGLIQTRIWDYKVSGDAMWFYVSQLTPGHMEKKVLTENVIQTEYLPMNLTLAERTQIGGQDFLLFELETVDSSAEKAAERFQMPPSIKGQRLRYGWIAYAAEGLTVGKPVINLVFATVITSGLDCKSLSSVVAHAKQH